MTCVTANWSAIKAQMMIPRKTINDDLALTGLTPEKFTLRSQQKGYITAQLLDNWFTSIFLPELAARRRAYNYDGPAVLPFDICTAYQSILFAQIHKEHAVRVCLFPPKSSNQRQPLRLGLFRATKWFLRRVNSLDSANIQTKHIAPMVCSFIAAGVPVNIERTFIMSGICLIKNEDRVLCAVRPDQARRFPIPPLHVSASL
jgi:hypothetical protein